MVVVVKWRRGGGRIEEREGNIHVGGWCHYSSVGSSASERYVVVGWHSNVVCGVYSGHPRAWLHGSSIQRHNGRLIYFRAAGCRNYVVKKKKLIFAITSDSTTDVGVPGSTGCAVGVGLLKPSSSLRFVLGLVGAGACDVEVACGGATTWGAGERLRSRSSSSLLLSLSARRFSLSALLFSLSPLSLWSLRSRTGLGVGEVTRFTWDIYVMSDEIISEN